MKYVIHDHSHGENQMYETIHALYQGSENSFCLKIKYYRVSHIEMSNSKWL